MKTTVNKLCAGCQLQCKQSTAVKLLQCPRYMKAPLHKQLALKI